MLRDLNEPLLILGGGGHARVLIDALRTSKRELLGVIDPKLSHGSRILDLTVLGGDEVMDHYSPDAVRLINGVGSVQSTGLRQRVYEKFKARGYVFASVVHSSALIGLNVELEEGVQIMAGVVIQTGCRIGANVILNTRASVDHDCAIGSHVHLAPGVTLSGAVVVDDSVHIGTGAVVIQGVHIGGHSLIGAGAVVLQDIPSGVKAVGVPADILVLVR